MEGPRQGAHVLYPAVLLVLVVGPPAIAWIVARRRDRGEPGRVRPFVWAALAGIVTAGAIHLASLDVDGMAVLGYGYAILASLAGALVCGLVGLWHWTAGRHRAADRQ